MAVRNALCIAIILSYVFSGCVYDDNRKKYLTDRRPVLSLELLDQNDDQVVVAVVFQPIDRANFPRVMDVQLDYDNTSLVLKSFNKGAAVVNASKELTVREKSQKGGIRLLIMGGNHNSLVENGVLAELTFEKRSSATSTLAFSEGHQVVAPASAVRQITYGPAITF